MSIKLGISGQKQLYRTAAAMREAGQRGLAKKLDQGTRSAVKEIEREVRASSDTYMPKGFEGTFKRSLEAKVSVRLATTRTVTITFTARGKQAERHLEQFEKGRLRAPVHGRYRWLKDGTRMRNPWRTHQIKPGVISEPAKRAERRAVQKVDAKVAELSRELNNIT